MKLSRYRQRKGGREYEVWALRLSMEDRLKLRNPASEYVIDDIDSNGTIFLKPVAASNTTVSLKLLGRKPYSSMVSSIRLHVSREELDRFKRLCRSHGSTMCRVLSDCVRGILAKEDSLLDPSGIIIQNIFTGVPRGPSRMVASKVRRRGR